ATAFTPTAQQWQTKKIDLSAFKSADEIRFAFECNSRNGNMLYIDNVQFYDEAKVGIAGPQLPAPAVYPVPADKVIYIQSKDLGAGTTLALYNMTGAQVATHTHTDAAQHTIALPVANLPAGS